MVHRDERSTAAPVEAACHCGAVRLELACAPIDVTACNCSICRRYGVLWAYYPRADVTVVVPTDIYMWDDRSIEFHRCKICGCITYWTPVDASADRMGINARLLDPTVLAAARVRHLDGAVTERYVD